MKPGPLAGFWGYEDKNRVAGLLCESRTKTENWPVTVGIRLGPSIQVSKLAGRYFRGLQRFSSTLSCRGSIPTEICDVLICGLSRSARLTNSGQKPQRLGAAVPGEAPTDGAFIYLGELRTKSEWKISFEH